MPFKKRKAETAGVAGPTSAKSTPAKKVRIGATSNIEDPVTVAAGRPKRTSAGEPNYKPARPRSTPVKNDTTNTKPEGEVKKRGRPAKAATVAPVAKKETSTASTASKATQVPPTEKKKAGRPRKNAVKKDTTASTVSPKVEVPAAKGRPRKSAASRASKPAVSTKPESEDFLDDTDTMAVNGNATNTNMEEAETLDNDIQYWLMKAEPESRMEKGHDVKFSIDDLEARAEPEPWDGVRNAVARNNMRAMRKGDLAFFYHSNCSIPGVAGVMRIVAEHSVDESAFDSNHPYYDPKSDREKPKWEVVHVEFVKKFANYVTLRDLKSFSQAGGVLEHMQMIKQSRLSVSSVSPAEWRFIMGLAGEDISLGHGPRDDGYETDIDGEGEDTAGEADGPAANGSSDHVMGLGITTATGGTEGELIANGD